MRSYRHQSGGRPIIVSSYRDSKDQLDALYASGRLRLPSIDTARAGAISAAA